MVAASSPRAFLVTSGAALVAGATAALAWGTLVERNMYTLRRVTVPILPAGSSRIRILHMSDLHMAPWQHHKQRWLRKLARLSPDLIVNTGDNLGHRHGLDGIVPALDVFKGTPGVFVSGSNDYFSPRGVNPFLYFTGPSRKARTTPDLNTHDLDDFFESLSWMNLNNGTAQLTVNGVTVDFLGVNDPHLHYDRLDALDSSESAPTESEGVTRLTLGVAHAPYRRILDAFVSRGADIIFAGHTHGGQVCVPGFGALVTNCDVPRRQVKGLSSWQFGGHSAWLNVSAGLGTSIYAPVRFACPPEVTLLTLVASSP